MFLSRLSLSLFFFIFFPPPVLGEGLTVELLTRLGKIDTLTFHTLKMRERMALLLNTVHYCFDS